MKRQALLLSMAAALVTLAPLVSHSAESHAEVHRHHLALFAGWGTESKEGHEDHDGFAIGIEYELRWSEHWGVGAVVEGLGQDTVRNVLVAIPISFHPGGGWRLVAGPGVEFTPKEDKLGLRLGVGYAFHIGANWSLVPETFLDLVETGERTWVVGLAAGYGF